MERLLRPAPDRLIVSEIFGPTFQGEGISVGRHAGFLRLGHCNLTCTWCDTAYTWDWSRYRPEAELKPMGIAEVADAVRQLGVDLLVVTGGEPLMQQPALARLLDLLPGIEIEMETNGTVTPRVAILERVRRFNVSPKLAHSGVPAGKRINAGPLLALLRSGRSVFKFVVRGPDDLDEIRALVDGYGLAPIYVMPEGTDADEILRRMRSLTSLVLARGWNLTPRLHILLWGEKRGV